MIGLIKKTFLIFLITAIFFTFGCKPIAQVKDFDIKSIQLEDVHTKWINKYRGII